MSTDPVSFYQATELLGTGGMGRVYRALHQPSGRVVALKTIQSARGRTDMQRLLVREAAAAAQLRHPNVVELLDFVVDDGRPFLVFELVEGHDAERFIDVWPGYATVSNLLGQVLDGLASAHGAGILHRDLKPSNLLVGRDGTLKIADFGMAELVDPLASRRERAFGGTPLYMAPEQLDPNGHQGPWTDLYAIGVIAYVLLAGTDPVSASARDWKGVKLRPPPFVPREGLHLPAEYVHLIESLIHPDAARRPRFAAEVRQMLGELEPRVHEDGVTGGAALIAVLPTQTSDLGSAPTQMAPLSQAPTITSDSSSSMHSSSRSDGTPRSMAPPPPPELPFALPGPAVLDATASLVRLRPPALCARRVERELGLDMVARASSERRAHVLLLRGEAGVGKSRLARWLLGEVERRGLMEATAAGYDVSGTSEGLKSALCRLFGSAPSRRITLDPARLEMLEAWLAPEAAVTPPHAERIELVVASLVAASRVRPLLLWLDDIAWSRDGAIETVLGVLQAEDAPIVTVLTLRSGSAEHPRVKHRLEALSAHPRVVDRSVPRLNFDERAEILAAAAPLRASVARELAELLDETPLLLVQLVHDYVESEALVPEADGFAPAGGRSVREIVAERPPERLLAQRIGKLVTAFGERAAEAEGVLIRATLLGQRFEERALRAACRTSKRRFVQSVIARSLLHGILRSERAERGERHRFEHDLLRSAMRQRLATRADRNELLISAAHGLIDAYGGARPEINLRAAQLLNEAGAIDEALERMAPGVIDLALVVDPRVDELLELAKSWAFAEPTEHRRARYHSLAGTAHYFLSRYDRSLEEVGKARELANATGDEQTLLECMAAEAGIFFFQGRYRESERVARELLSRAPRGDPSHAEHGMNSAHRLAEIAVLRGDLDAALHLYRLAHDYAKIMPGALREPHMALATAELELARNDTASARAWLDTLAPRAHAVESSSWRDIYLDTELKYRVAIGELAETSHEIAARIADLEARQDVWRLTALRVLDALAAAAEGGERVAPAVDAMLAAFETCSHEKPFTLWALEQIVARLDALALGEHAALVRALMEAQRARFDGSD